MLKFRKLYIFFVILSLNLFFFSTTNLNAKAFLIEEIEISQPFKNNFEKSNVIDKGFKRAFKDLTSLLIKSTDLEKVKNVQLNEIKGMIESFSIKEEKFINEIYYVNLGVSFDKKKVFNFLEKRNIFPTQIIKKTFLFIPIIIDQADQDIIVFSNNPIHKRWTKTDDNYLIKYLLPTEDLEDLNLIKQKSDIIENYDFMPIIKKYFLNHSIVSLIFRNDKEIKVLGEVNIDDEVFIRNDSFKRFNFENIDEIDTFIGRLKLLYEDQWKEYNQINTSIKLPLSIRVNNKDLKTSLKFENILSDVDLISDYSINKYDKNFVYYEITFNGTPKNFINIMKNKNYSFNATKKIWILNED